MRVLATIGEICEAGLLGEVCKVKKWDPHKVHATAPIEHSVEFTVEEAFECGLLRVIEDGD